MMDATIDRDNIREVKNKDHIQCTFQLEKIQLCWCSYGGKLVRSGARHKTS